MALIPFNLVGVDAPLFYFPFTGVSALLQKVCHKKQETEEGILKSCGCNTSTMVLIPFILVGVDAPLFYFPFTGVSLL